jgi:hypothetical protein
LIREHSNGNSNGGIPTNEEPYSKLSGETTTDSVERQWGFTGPVGFEPTILGWLRELNKRPEQSPKAHVLVLARLRAHTVPLVGPHLLSYTLVVLDHLAPGAILYLKTRGRIEAEYLQLPKTIGL